jgi:hypothetical protein
MKQEKWDRLHKELDDALYSGFDISKQFTAVRYLEEIYWNNEGIITLKDLEKAKQMEKEQIINAWDKRGANIVPKYFLEENINGEQYYKLTYDNNNSNP